MKKRLKVFPKIAIILSLMTCICLSIRGNRSHADAGYNTDYGGGSSSSSSSDYSYSGGNYYFGSSSFGNGGNRLDRFLILDSNHYYCSVYTKQER